MCFGSHQWQPLYHENLYAIVMDVSDVCVWLRDSWSGFNRWMEKTCFGCNTRSFYCLAGLRGTKWLLNGAVNSLPGLMLHQGIAWRRKGWPQTYTRCSPVQQSWRLGRAFEYDRELLNSYTHLLYVVRPGTRKIIRMNELLHCVASYPSYLCCDSDISLFLFPLTNVLTVRRFW